MDSFSLANSAIADIVNRTNTAHSRKKEEFHSGILPFSFIQLLISQNRFGSLQDHGHLHGLVLP